MKWASRERYAKDADLTLYWPDVRPCWEAMLKGPEEWTLNEKEHWMGYPSPHDEEAGERSEQEAIKEMQARERYRELEAQANRRIVVRPRCRADLSITPLGADGMFEDGKDSTTLMATGSMVFVGEIVRAAGRIFAEEMYMNEVGVPDSVNRED